MDIPVSAFPIASGYAKIACPGGEIGPDMCRPGRKIVALKDSTPGRTGQTI
jgi:hypothetical protein